MVKRTPDIGRASAIRPLLETAAAVHRAGDLPRARALYGEVLEHDPDNADALHLLGVIAGQQGNNDAALELIGRAISLQGQTAAFHASLARVLRQLGRAREAEACYRVALRLDPGLFEVMLKLGNIHRERGELSDAETCYCNALARKPDYAEAHANLGVVLKARGHLDSAISHYRTALQHRPDLSPVHYDLGNALQAQTKTTQAIASYREAVRLDPAYADAHLNLAIALLLAGEFDEGWREYEWRWKCDAARKINVLRGGFAQPAWDGTDPAGRRILLQSEQGYGDAIQFVRFADALARRGATVIVECQPDLKRLFASAAGVAQVVARDEPLPDFDLHCPLISVARILRIGLDSIPADVPYLSGGATRSAYWRERLGGEHGTLRVGLVWAGAPENSYDRTRSMSLAALSPLAAVPGIAFYSVQKGPAAVQAASPPAGMRLHDHTGQLKDFADNAALIENLDLVISVDTSVAHLAGALGKPVWTLLEFAPDWRWMLGRDTTPWYPSMRLFRQEHAREWGGVIERVRLALEELVRIRRLPHATGGATVSALQTALALHQAAKWEQAASIYREVLLHEPANPDALHLLGMLAVQQGDAERAAELVGRAIELKPDAHEFRNTMGIVMRKRDLPEEAISAYREALRLKPDYAEAHHNLGLVLRAQGRLEDALSCYREALRLKPGYAAAHWSFAHALLLCGDYERGWQEFEWRWETDELGTGKRGFAQPLWLGGDIAGQRLLLHAEQGSGDAIQFIRYVPLLAARGARVILECKPELRRLFSSVAGLEQLVLRGEALPGFDVHCPLMSLPLAFGTRLETIPATVPYLRADPALCDKWRLRLAGAEARLKVGLVWAGNPAHRNDDRNRSLALADLAPLAGIPEIAFYSLQKGAAAEELRSAPDGMRIVDCGAELADFADTAALVSEIDLLIAVDTAVVHLAGALGKPAWALLPSAPDWRWLLERDDSPWYPSLRLFRQTRAGDWHAVVTHVARALALLERSKNPTNSLN